MLAQFACRGSLTNHQWAPNDRVKYPRSQCGQQFSQKGHLARHIIIISHYMKKSINTEKKSSINIKSIKISVIEEECKKWGGTFSQPIRLYRVGKGGGRRF